MCVCVLLLADLDKSLDTQLFWELGMLKRNKKHSLSFFIRIETMDYGGLPPLISILFVKGEYEVWIFVSPFFGATLISLPRISSSMFPQKTSEDVSLNVEI